MNENEKFKRCSYACRDALYAGRFCRVYGRAVRHCRDCAFSTLERPKWLDSLSKVKAAKEAAEQAADPHAIILEELLHRLKAMNWDALDEETLFAVWRTIVKGGRW